jgi:hypothetical protein
VADQLRPSAQEVAPPAAVKPIAGDHPLKLKEASLVAKEQALAALDAREQKHAGHDLKAVKTRTALQLREVRAAISQLAGGQ